jgi:hypothetical protein
MLVFPNLAYLGNPLGWEVFFAGRTIERWRKLEMVGDRCLGNIFTTMFHQKMDLPFQISCELEKMFRENKLWTGWCNSIPGINVIPNAEKRADAFEVTSLPEHQVVRSYELVLPRPSQRRSSVSLHFK